MSDSGTKRCGRCGKTQSRANFNDSKRSRDGLAANCRACVNRRRRELSARKRSSAESASVNLVDAARRGKIEILKKHAGDNPELLENLLWKTVQDFHTIRKRPAHVDQARFLIGRGAQPHWKMVCAAARGGHQALADVLLENGVVVNLCVAAALGDEETVARLVAEEGSTFPPGEDSATPLHCCGLSALGKGDAERSEAFVGCAKRLLDAGADVNALAEIDGLPDVKPLDCVCWTGGKIELARLLLDRGADPAGSLKFALGHFHRHGDGHYHIAELLLASGIDIHEEGDPVLGRFAAHEDARGVRWLLERGADPNVVSAEGRTPLHRAAERNQGVKVVSLLVEHGVDTTAKTADGQTALDIAELNDKRAVAAHLRSVAGKASTQ